MRSEEFIKENVKEYFAQGENDSGIIIAPVKTGKDEKRIVNASQKIAKGLNPAYIAAVYDTTLFGSAKEGLAFTGEKIYYREAFSEPIEIDLNKVIGSEYSEQKIVDSNGKEKTSYELTIKFEDEKENIILNGSGSSRISKALADFLNKFVEEVSETASTDHQKTLKDCGDEVILAYLKVVTNFIRRNGKMDTKSFVSLAELIGSLELNGDLSNKLREYRNGTDKIESNEKLIEIMKTEIEEGSQVEIFQSLINDLILTVPYDKYSELKNDLDFKEIQEKLNVTDEQVDFFIEKYTQDREIIANRTTDKEAKKMREELAGIAGATGASLAAFGVTGMMVGAFGEFGALALATMSTGGIALAVAGITTAGIVGYNGIKKLSSGRLEDSVIRQSLLQNALQRHEAGMQLMISDINYLTNEITKQAEAAKNNSDKIKILFEKIKQLKYTNEAINHSRKSEQYNRRELILSDLPKSLEVEKLDSLLKKDINGEKYGQALDDIYSYKEGDNMLNEEADLNKLDICQKILEAIGYNKIATAANAKSVGKKFFSKLAELGDNE